MRRDRRPPAGTLFRAPRSGTRRASSWDAPGGTDDVRGPPGESATYAEPWYRGEFAVALERVRALDLP